MTGPKGNSEVCFLESLDVSRGEAEGNIDRNLRINRVDGTATIC